MKLAGITKYLYEIGSLKHQKRTGWWRMGVKDPETVAEHSYRAAVIGYIIAALEGANPERTACLCLFHDTAETRIGDLHWVAKHYISTKEGENAAFRDQAEQLPQTIAEKINALANEYQQKTSHEARLAREADLLECLLQSREYEIQGYSKALEWAKLCRDGLQTPVAKELANTCLEEDPGDWFRDIQQNPRYQQKTK